MFLRGLPLLRGLPFLSDLPFLRGLNVLHVLSGLNSLSSLNTLNTWTNHHRNNHATRESAGSNSFIHLPANDDGGEVHGAEEQGQHGALQTQQAPQADLVAAAVAAGGLASARLRRQPDIVIHDLGSRQVHVLGFIGMVLGEITRLQMHAL